jgi:hypothetical protein
LTVAKAIIKLFNKKSRGGDLLKVLLHIGFLCAKVLACPELSGEYRCSQQGETVEIKFQTVSSIPFKVKINDKLWSPQQGWHKFHEEGMVGEQRIQCPADRSDLQLQFRGDFYNSKNENFGSFDVTNHFFLKNEQTLIWTQQGQYNFDFEAKPWPVDEISHCERM